MSEKTLLLISPLAEIEPFARAAAAAAQLKLVVVPDTAQAIEILKTQTPSAVFVSIESSEEYQNFEKTIQDSIGIFSETLHSNSMHFISALELEKLTFVLRSPLFGHYIYRNYTDPTEAGTRYGRVVLATQLGRAFGLASLLKPGTKIQTVSLASSTQKNEAIEAVKFYLVSAKFQARMATLIANAVDELLLNAIFDAPIDELGKPIYARTARATVIKLEEKSAVEMQLAFDGEQVAIMVADRYGSLDKERLLTHLSKFYGEENYQLKTNTAGAGLGLATVFRSGGSFFFASENGVRTETTVFFKRTASYREFKDQFRFISTQFYF